MKVLSARNIFACKNYMRRKKLTYLRVEFVVHDFLLRLLYYPSLETPNVQIEFVYKRKVR